MCNICQDKGVYFEDKLIYCSCVHGQMQYTVTKPKKENKPNFVLTHRYINEAAVEIFVVFQDTRICRIVYKWDGQVTWCFSSSFLVCDNITFLADLEKQVHKLCDSLV